MIPDVRDVECVMCGKKSRQHCGYLSFNSHTFSYDFFGNPNIKQGAQYCPHCGYANDSIDSEYFRKILNKLNKKEDKNDAGLFKKDEEVFKKLKEFIETEAYKTCDYHEELLEDNWEWVIHNYKSYLVHEFLGDYESCVFILQYLVFRIDSRYLALYAKDFLGDDYKVDEWKDYYDYVESERLGKPRFRISSKDKDKNVKELMKYTQNTLIWMLKKYLKYAKQFIDSHILDTSITDINSYVYLLINYVYYQRRVNHISEAEMYLALLNDIPNKYEIEDWLKLKIIVFNQIEKENIDCIKNKKEIFILNNAFGFYDEAEITCRERNKRW